MSEELKGCIYLINHKETGKKYIGQHNKEEPSYRWKKHITAAKRGILKYALYNAINKYGKDAFTIERLCTCKYSELGNMEAYYAEQFESYTWDDPGGYNMVWCGKNFMLGITHTEEVREKLRKNNTGRKASEETKIKMSKSQTGLKRSEQGCKNIQQGKINNPISPEGLENLRKIREGKKMSEEARNNMKKAHDRIKKIKLEGGAIAVDESLKNKFPCRYNGCNKILSSKPSLKLHGRTHTNEKPYKCKECNATFACGSNLDQHMIKHTKDKLHECSKCNKKFKYASTLKKHMNKLHLTDTPQSMASLDLEPA